MAHYAPTLTGNDRLHSRRGRLAAASDPAASDSAASDPAPRRPKKTVRSLGENVTVTMEGGSMVVTVSGDLTVLPGDVLCFGPWCPQPPEIRQKRRGRDWPIGEHDALNRTDERAASAAPEPALLLLYTLFDLPPPIDGFAPWGFPETAPAATNATGGSRAQSTAPPAAPDAVDDASSKPPAKKPAAKKPAAKKPAAKKPPAAVPPGPSRLATALSASLQAMRFGEVRRSALDLAPAAPSPLAAPPPVARRPWRAVALPPPSRPPPMLPPPRRRLAASNRIASYPTPTTEYRASNRSASPRLAASPPLPPPPPRALRTREADPPPALPPPPKRLLITAPRGDRPPAAKHRRAANPSAKLVQGASAALTAEPAALLAFGTAAATALLTDHASNATRRVEACEPARLPNRTRAEARRSPR